MYELLSLDSVAEKPDGFITDWDDAMDANLGAVIAAQDSVIGELVEFVRDLKNQPGADIGVHASISVAQALLAADVVDELRLVIAPAIAGSGRRLLDGLPALRLEPIRSTTSPTGHLLADYAVIG